MKKAEKQNFLEWNKSIFVSSARKISLDIILIIALDALFYALSGFLVYFWLQRMQEKITAFNLPADIMALGYERAQQIASEIKAFYYLIIFSFVLLLIAIIFLASILKGAIWAKTTGTKITFRLISKFLALNLIWMGFWFLVIFLVSWLVKPALAPAFMAGAAALAAYFTNTLYVIFMKSQSLKCIIHAIRLNIAKIHLFLLPYIAIFLLFFIIARLGSFLKFGYPAILLGLILITYASVVRYYVSELVLEIEKSK